MASLKEAERAREQHAEKLRQLGAHAIAVDEIERDGEKTFAVIAGFEHPPGDQVPTSLTVKSGRKKIEVPLAVSVIKKFKPEKL